MERISTKNNGRSKFLKDLKCGKIGEQEFIELLNNLNIQYSLCSANLEEYDILFEINSEKFTVEIKYDKYEEKSGNLAIEYYNPKANKDSGINISKADYWVVILSKNLSNSIWITSLEKLKEYISNNKCLRDIKYAGDGNASIYLYESKKILKDIFIPIDLIQSEEDLCFILKNLKEKKKI